MHPVLPLLLPLLLPPALLAPRTAAYTGPLQAEISNGTFHHFFVPDGYYDETEDPEKCQMLFKFWDALPWACAAGDDGGDAPVRDDFLIAKLQAEDAARLLEGIGRAVAHDLDGERSYGELLRREIAQIGDAFSGVDASLQELEGKFKQSQESELLEEMQLGGSVLKRVGDVRGGLRDTAAVAVGLRDKHELLSLIVRSHGSRLSRLKTEYLNVGL